MTFLEHFYYGNIDPHEYCISNDSHFSKIIKRSNKLSKLYNQTQYKSLRFVKVKSGGFIILDIDMGMKMLHTYVSKKSIKYLLVKIVLDFDATNL